jgi:hypothetical protein
MTPVALDGSKLLILMVAGGVFALSGLWLMFRQPAAGEAAKIEIFGLKFQSSSAGLLVFLIGSVFLGVPIVVPEKTGDVGEAPVPRPGAEQITRPDDVRRESTSTTPPREPEGPGGSSDDPAPAQGGASPPVRARATGREIEPNEQYEGANRLELGNSVAGSVARLEEDWFAIALAPEQHRIEVRIRSNDDCTGSYIHAYSPEERELLGSAEGLGNINTSKTWAIKTAGAPWIFLRLQNAFGNSCDYELFTSAVMD